MFLGTIISNHSLFLWVAISLIFLYMCLIIAAVSNFNGYKLIGLFKANSRNTKKMYENVQS